MLKYTGMMRIVSSAVMADAVADEEDDDDDDDGDDHHQGDIHPRTT